ncbi:MAG: DUF1588 domain-containing protein [Oligoflexus sp.]|nr:DUF1588 domain-containing protein [Oligoflexus sp.]
MRVILAISLIFGLQACSAKPKRINISKLGGVDPGLGDPPTPVSGDDTPAVKCDALDLACLALKFPEGKKCEENFTEAQEGLKVLSNEEIKNSINQALGIDATKILQDLPRRDQGTKFQNATARSAIAQNMVDNWSDISYDIATALVADTAALAKLVPCKTATKDCSEKLVTSLGLLLWRSPATAADLVTYNKLFATGKADFKESAMRAVTGMLLDPRFLYKISESGTADDEISPYELATRMSYFIWRSTPDKLLLDKAKDGSLSKDEVRKSEIDRMMADPKAEVAFRAFMTEWLALGNIDNLQIKGETIDPAAKRKDVLDKAVTLIFQGSGDFRLAFGKDDKDNILTMPGLLGGLNVSSETSPVKRGLFFSGRLLCRQVPPPPGNAGAFKAETLALDTTPRERLKVHESNSSCASCHASVDPIGLGLETFDALGRIRDVYASKVAIDAAGSMKLDRINYPFKTAQELMHGIGNSTDLAACVTVTVAEYAMGATPEDKNSCEMSHLQNAFAKSGYQWRGLVDAIVNSKSFSKRVAP